MGDDDLVRREVRDQVAARTPVDERERASIAEFLDTFDRLASPFDEHADPSHVTASAIVIGARGVVLHRHKRLGLWLQPGGHIDAGELPAAAALREAAEETGLPVSWPEGVGDDPPLVHVDVHDGPRGHRHLDLRYLVHAAAGRPARRGPTRARTCAGSGGPRRSSARGRRADRRAADALAPPA